ncbi:unnamed protein product [Pleuronectes platessa]|uniref:Uncharacterized protein n=1 Tax=Pleuronectes platessa TaxID=8262 RepID=A0A9N7Y1W1_PLEPL|nr:unnamed protein product [Pleuronectes platessa]
MCREHFFYNLRLNLKPASQLPVEDCTVILLVMEVSWKLVKGELRQQLMSYAGFSVDLMHQGDQKVLIFKPARYERKRLSGNKSRGKRRPSREKMWKCGKPKDSEGTVEEVECEDEDAYSYNELRCRTAADTLPV